MIMPLLQRLNFAQLLLLSTQPGKLFGVNSVTGELVWWKNLPCFSTCKIWKTHVLRPDRAVTITRDESSSTTTLHFYNPRAATFEEPVFYYCDAWRCICCHGVALSLGYAFKLLY